MARGTLPRLHVRLEWGRECQVTVSAAGAVEFAPAPGTVFHPADGAMDEAEPVHLDRRESARTLGDAESAEHALRWRHGEEDEGQSKWRVVEWSDGSMSLHIGAEAIFEVMQVPRTLPPAAGSGGGQTQGARPTLPRVAPPLPEAAARAAGGAGADTCARVAPHVHRLVAKQDGAVRTGTEDAVDVAAAHGILPRKLPMQRGPSSTGQQRMRQASSRPCHPNARPRPTSRPRPPGLGKPAAPCHANPRGSLAAAHTARQPYRPPAMGTSPKPPSSRTPQPRA
jgi:hypothetical protein